jgi:hypothetical protein
MLSTITYTNVDVVRAAIKIFRQLDMMEILDDGTYFMNEVEKMVGSAVDNDNANRQRRFRERKKQLALPERYADVTKNNENKSIEKEKEIDIEIDSEIKRETVNYQLVADMYNETCVSFPRLKTLSDSRKKAIKARMNTYTEEDFKTLFEKAEASSFLKGENNRNWTATFDWLIKDANMAKVLEGNYDKGAQSKGRKEPTPKWCCTNDDVMKYIDDAPKTAKDDPVLAAKAAKLQEDILKWV